MSEHLKNLLANHRSRNTSKIETEQRIQRPTKEELSSEEEQEINKTIYRLINHLAGFHKFGISDDRFILITETIIKYLLPFKGKPVSAIQIKFDLVESKTPYSQKIELSTENIKPNSSNFTEKDIPELVDLVNQYREINKKYYKELMDYKYKDLEGQLREAERKLIIAEGKLAANFIN